MTALLIRLVKQYNRNLAQFTKKEATSFKKELIALAKEEGEEINHLFLSISPAPTPKPQTTKSIKKTAPAPKKEAITSPPKTVKKESKAITPAKKRVIQSPAKKGSLSKEKAKESVKKVFEEKNKSDLIDALKDLRNSVKNEIGEFSSSEISKIYYTNAIKILLEKKVISDLLRKRINRYNKKNFGSKLLGSNFTEHEAIVGGIDLILDNLNPKTPAPKKEEKKKVEKKVGAKSKILTYDQILEEAPEFKKFVKTMKDYIRVDMIEKQNLELIKQIKKLFKLTNSSPEQNYKKGMILEQYYDKVYWDMKDYSKFIPLLVNTPNSKTLETILLRENEEDKGSDYWAEYQINKKLPKGLHKLNLKTKNSLKLCKDCPDKQFEVWLNQDNIYIVDTYEDKLFAKLNGNAESVLRIWNKFKNDLSKYDWTKSISEFTDKQIQARKDFIESINNTGQMTLANRPKRQKKVLVYGISDKGNAKSFLSAKKVITSKKLSFADKLRQLIKY